jgi:ferrous iron transport protein B
VAALAPLDERAARVERLATARYARVAGWLDGVVTRAPSGRPRSAQLTSRIDAVVLHPVLGPVVLLAVFGSLFQALFTWSAPLMDLIEAGVGRVSETVAPLLPASMPLLRSLVVDGVLAGVGNVVVFVPQIAVLFLFLGLLEDSGYLARAAFLLDRVMARTGLHGRAFVPLLSGFACAVPAIMATRTIENRRDRLVTILVTPLVSCSARLPVYGLMIATVFATQPPILGVLHVGAAVMIGMYLLSIVAALAMAAVFKRTLLKSPPPPFVLELPLYRTPRLGQLGRHVASKVRAFLVDAGTVILALTVVLWALFNFPRPAGAEHRRDAEVAAVVASFDDESARAEAVSAIEGRYGEEQLEYSVAGRLGHAIEPVLRPLGFDWKVGVGLIASFAAREVMVSTLGLVYGLGNGNDDESVSLREAMRRDRTPSGAPVHTPLSGLALMVFFVLAMQCMSTLAAVRRETQGWRWPAFQFAYMTALAYVGALLVHQGGRLLGLA